MIWLDFVCMGLATWRLSSLITRSQGPYQAFAHVRNWADPAGIQRDGSLGELLTCLWCMSVWCAVVIWMLPIEVSYILSLSAVAMIIDGTMPNEAED